MIMNVKQFALTIVLMTAPVMAAQAAPELGQPAPSFKGSTTAGGQIALEDYKGKVVVLEWTNHLCPFVGKHYDSGNMQATQARLTDEGAVWLTIISSAPGKQGFVSSEEADRLTVSRKANPTEVILDPEGKIGRAYEAKVTPHMFIIDENQNVVYKGAIDSIRSARQSDIEKADNYVLSAFAAMQAGTQIADADTKAYGCTVKYSY